jgi:hypothetical protein
VERPFCRINSQEDQDMPNRLKSGMGLLALIGLLAFMPASGGSQDKAQAASNSAQNQAKMQGAVVYVCACLKTKSCSCMTEAKMEGPCACGTEGGPPLKAVPQDSSWAKENREALAK